MVQRYDMEKKFVEASDGDWVRFEDYYWTIKAIRKAISILANESDIFLAVSMAEDELKQTLSESGEEA